MLEAILNRLGLEGAAADVGAVLIIVALTVVAGLVARAVVVQLLSRMARRTATELDDVLIRYTGPLIVKLVYLSGLRALSRHLEGKYELFSGAIVDVVNGILFSLIVITVALYLMRLLAGLTDWYGSEIAIKTESTFDDEIMPLIRRVGRVLIGIVSVMIILDHFHVDIKGLVAVLGVGSLAIALAAQETLSNMIGGFVIMVDRPFRKGDRVILGDGTKCDVYQIGMRSTKFLTFENTLVIVPNAELIKATINNLTYPEPRIRVKVDVGVAYGSDIDQVKNLLEDVAANHSNVIEDVPPQAQFREMADSSLNFSLVCRVREVKDQWKTSLEIREEIYRRLNAAGIEIPFPQRVVHLVQPSEKEKATSDKKSEPRGSLLKRASGDSGDYASLEDGED